MGNATIGLARSSSLLTGFFSGCLISEYDILQSRQSRSVRSAAFLVASGFLFNFPGRISGSVFLQLNIFQNPDVILKCLERLVADDERRYTWRSS